jgi:hypothetical protein
MSALIMWVLIAMSGAYSFLVRRWNGQAKALLVGAIYFTLGALGWLALAYIQVREKLPEGCNS